MNVAALGLALLLGVVAGSRTFLAPAALAWAAFLGWLEASGGWLLVFGHPWARWIWSALALGELVADQLPFTPSRTVPFQFGGRIVSGAVCGGAIGASAGSGLLGAIAGIVGAGIGTLGGRALRGKMAAAFGNDHPAAFVEDALAIAVAVAVVMGMR
ncbi:MAG TPA: DUF4126 domain-containing protein [Vicinamibacteria bacterium]|nr:DUF4126 domain-containing protein [Vicinamibacteria bacterium]